MMMNISSRQRQIVDILLREPDGITVGQIAEEVQVSSRTVHRELKAIEKLIRSYDLKLEKKAGTGLSLQGSKEKRDELKEALSESKPAEYTPAERKTAILCTLLEAAEPVKIFSLASDLKVTPATISHDLDQLEDWVKQYHLELIRRRGYGVEIAGTEAAKRKAISALIFEHLDESRLLELLKEITPDKSLQTIDSASERLLHLIPKEKLMAIGNALENMNHLLPYSLADSAYIGLVIHLSLAIDRMEKGKTIAIDPVYLKELERTPEFEAAQKIASRLKSDFGISFPPDEIGYVAMHLRGAKLRFSETGVLEDPNAELTAIATHLIHLCEEQLGVPLSGDRSLLQDLIAHLEPAIHRMKRNMKIRNPLLGKIQEDYPDLFQIVKRAAKMAFPHLQVPDEEIGYLVMHIGAAMERKRRAQKRFRVVIVCSSGIGSSKMLASRLQSAIPEIQVQRNASVFELDSIDERDYDFIISTIPIPSKKPEEYLMVSPMLTDRDIAKIHSFLNDYTPQAQIKTESVIETNRLDQLESVHASLGHAIQLMKDFQLSHIQNAGMNLESILLQACETLKNKGILKQAEPVVRQLLEREKLGGLGIPNTKLGLFHCRSDDVTKLSLTLYSLSEPFPLRSMDEGTIEIDKFLLMLSPVSAPKEAIEILSEISAKIIEPETGKILESNDPSRIQGYFTQTLVRFCFEKMNPEE